MTTAFPEVRLKKYLEMRGADGGPWNRLCALPAFWVGLLYDDAALDAAWDLVKDFSLAERNALRDGVPRHGLKLPARIGGVRNGSVRDLALEALKIAAGGLQRRARRNSQGTDESRFLEPLIEFAEANETRGRTQAGAVPWRVGRQYRPRVPRVRLLDELVAGSCTEHAATQHDPA
jgi:glutamate--cysteine ligase